MSTPPPPARVFGFVAAEADVCVLLRRGPSKQVLMVRWNLATDEFEVGQWLKARVHEDRSGLSPDGRFLVYFAADWSMRHGEERGSYVVVSRPPYFTALALWFGSGMHFGGAFWKGKNRLAVDGLGLAKGSIPSWLRVDDIVSKHAPWWHRHNADLPVSPCAFLGQKGLFRVDENGFRMGEERLDADWADVDHRGRLLIARQGRIYVRDATGERELIDLNPFEFRPLAPPQWAIEWPE